MIVEHIANLREKVDEVQNEGPADTDMPIRRPVNEANLVASRARLPPLARAGGPSTSHVEGAIGGMVALYTATDPRVQAVSLGFPISIHPLRTPNARGSISTGSDESALDFRFLRLAGLLHKMIPLRDGVDDVRMQALDGSPVAPIYGRVTVVFDVQGYEFEHTFWVVNLGVPVDMQLGSDFLVKFEISLGFGPWGGQISSADAKKVRKLEDIYVLQ
ncbi:hypothetical protein EUX98_g1323 [Antrodiella citrinella]|uniref:Uncharacterized protein n=1 Tax=Antrodiella citrinella TaxID=2447956 RepID=A0A4S4N3B9_9APHY|nr:hypothetical protein EUX98_g1323 [Antrodiella citrinella]